MYRLLARPPIAISLPGCINRRNAFRSNSAFVTNSALGCVKTCQGTGSVLQPLKRRLVVRAEAGAAAFPVPAPEPTPPPSLGDTARKALLRATRAVSRYGWTAFWIQLSLSIISAVILLFSVAFTSPVSSGPKASLYLTLVGVLCGFLSTFWNFGYTRLALKMQAFIDAPPGIDVPKVKKQQVLDMVTKGLLINMVGLGSTLLGVQTLVGLLVAKTLSNASVNPFLASASGSYNPVLALDVFLVQAAINTLLGHFLSLCSSLWLLNVVGEGKGLKFQVPAGEPILEEIDVVPTTRKEKSLPPPQPVSVEVERPTFSPAVTSAARVLMRSIIDTHDIVEDRKRIRPFTIYPTAASLSYLDGSMPGDYGFDPLGLYKQYNVGQAVIDRRWLQTSEIVHGRWAMLGAAGCLAPEYLGYKGLIPKAAALPWFEAGNYHYWTSNSNLAVIGITAMAVAESGRFAEYVAPRSVANMNLQGAEVIFNDTTGDPAYPGGKVFNFISPLDGADLLLDMKEREVKHGRIAMLACLGYMVQASVTHKGPYANLIQHFEDPGLNNWLGYVFGGQH